MSDPEITELERLQALADATMISLQQTLENCDRLTGRLADLKIENWQLRGALGYEVPGQIPCGDFKCGLCEAKANDIERAREYATNLLVSFVNEHCSPVPEWKPLPDLLGVLTQLDNATTITRDYKAEITRLQGDLRRAKKPRPSPMCEECGVNRADPPSRLCPGCQAYREHQQ